MQIPCSSGCAIALTVRSRLEQLSLSWSEFRNRQCQFRDALRHSTTLAIVVNQLSGTFVRNAGRQSSPIWPSCRDSRLSRLAPWMTRVGSILKCTSIATARSAGLPYPKAVKNLRRCPRKPPDLPSPFRRGVHGPRGSGCGGSTAMRTNVRNLSTQSSGTTVLICCWSRTSMEFLRTKGS